MKDIIALLSVMAGILQMACNSSPDIAPMVDVNLNFSHLMNSQPVQLDKLIYQNSLGQDFSIKTIKYFISDVKLYKADGQVFEFPDIHYVNIRTPETLTYRFSEKIPEGKYTGISFVYGLTKEENISGRFPDPPESLMEWPEILGGGYHYMKLEGEYKMANEVLFFNFHARMLDGVSNEIHIYDLDHPFSVTSKALNLDIAMEIQHWFTNPNDWDFTYFGPNIMSNAEAQQAIHENGKDVFSITIKDDQP